MVLLRGGSTSTKGAELIASKWATIGKVPQIAFKPDWTKHAKAAPFKRNGAMLELLPIGVMHFTGTGIAVNLKGPRNTMKLAATRLREGGRIINLSSSVVGLYQPTYGVYAATKAGVEAMTHALAKELRGRNITVNAIAPGSTATALFLDGKPQGVIDSLTKLAPLERLGRPRARS